MRKTSTRKPSFESCEDRIALSAVSPFRFGYAFNSSSSFTRNVQAADNSTATATDLGQLDGSTSVQGFVGTTDQRDVYRFELARDGELSLQLSGLSSDADIYILDANRSIIAESRNGGASSESIQGNVAAGEYFVAVERYRSWNSTNYTLDVSATLTSPPADGAGNTFSTAAQIGGLEGAREFTGNVGQFGDTADLIEFSVTETSHVVFDLTDLDQDLDMYLYAGHQSPLVSARASGTSNEQIDAWIAPGTYYLGIVPYGSSSSDYSLSMTNLTTAVAPTPTEPPATTPTPTVPVTVPTTPADSAPATPPQPSVPSNEPLADVSYFGSRRDWGVNDVRAPEAWSVGYAGAGITVAVIDSGVQLNHPDLVDSIWENTDEILGDGIDNDGNGYIDDRFGWDFIGNDNNPTDSNSHGTHVAGIIAAANNGSGATGVAPDAQIMPIRVLGQNGSGSNRAVAQGIVYAVDNGADIINLSLGGSFSSQIRSALQYAARNDVLVVAAAGNESAGVPGYPAGFSDSFANVISVGAYDSNRRVASFSNAVGNSGAVQVDAPGVSVYSTVPNSGYSYLSGTSMASPFVAGVAALTLSANPDLTSTELRQVLTQSSTGSVSGSDGVGSVDAGRAIPLALSIA